MPSHPVRSAKRLARGKRRQEHVGREACAPGSKLVQAETARLEQFGLAAVFFANIFTNVRFRLVFGGRRTSRADDGRCGTCCVTALVVGARLVLEGGPSTKLSIEGIKPTV
jgi:hypothetical protein